MPMVGGTRAEGVGEGLRAVEGYGGALGPDWLKTMGLEGGRTTQGERPNKTLMCGRDVCPSGDRWG